MANRAILLVNLGSPDSPSVSDVRRYLDQFLMDGYVLDVPTPIRRMIVSCFILPFRPRSSAAAYRSIWWDQGSPLVVISERVRELLESELDVPIGLGMRYGNPSIARGLEQLAAVHDRLDEVLLVPLYPHYAMSTVTTVEVATHEALAAFDPAPALRVLPPFYDAPEYIDALVASAEEARAWDHDHLLFSYHGLPERHLRKTDPTGRHCLTSPDCCTAPSPAHARCYRHQVFRSTELFVERAGIPSGTYSIAFQSRLGRGWLEPFTDREIQRLAGEGKKRLLVICPAFVSDCLETLEEIGIRGRETFIEAGGEELRLIPCMNDHSRWIEALARLCRRALDAATPASRTSSLPA